MREERTGWKCSGINFNDARDAARGLEMIECLVLGKNA